MKDQRPDIAGSLGPLIRGAEELRFEPGFVDRVMGRIRAEGGPPVVVLSSALTRQFWRLATVAAGLLLALGAYNLLGPGSASGQSVVETALGLQPITLEAAYAFDGSLDASGFGESE